MEELHNFTLLKEELKADFKDKDEKSMDLSQLKQQLLNSIQQKLERFKGKKCRYFLLKCKTSHSLSESKQKGIWAVPLRFK